MPPLRAPASRTRGRTWCFTVNNPPVSLFPGHPHPRPQSDTEWSVAACSDPVDAYEHFHRLTDALTSSANVRYLVWQLERGESGTPHIQGYIEYQQSMRFSAVRNHLPRGAHIEPRHGTASEASEYCQKPDGRIVGPFCHGTISVASQGIWAPRRLSFL